MNRRDEKLEKVSKAIRNRRVCYDCASSITDDDLRVCPECGSSELDERRARPKEIRERPAPELPHPWNEFKLEHGGTVLLSGNAGSGKAQPMSSKVLTPTGWKTMGDLTVGDKVVDPDGGQGLVTGIYERGTREVFKVTMKDGGTTRCCSEHLWLVQSHNQIRNSTHQVRSLKEIQERGIRYKSPASTFSRHNWFIPLPRAIAFQRNGPLPLCPYLLGALLGDGGLGSGSPGFSSADAEILDLVKKSIKKLPTTKFGDNIELKHKSKYDYAITGPRKGSTGKNPLTQILKKLGVWGQLSYQKHIPEKYLFASVNNRIELLRGLMDTDGDIKDKGTTITFNTTSNQLANNVVDLVRGLGGTAKKSKGRKNSYQYRGEKRTGRDSYRVHIKTLFCPFHLSRKANRWTNKRILRAIEDVQADGTETTRCIRVSTQRNLYITDDHIVTHNTTICMAVHPTRYISSEQEIQQVAKSWFRVNPGRTSPIISNCYSWEQLSLDLIGISEEDLIVVDSVSQLAMGEEAKQIVKQVIEQVRAARARAIFIVQFRKDGAMLGPNELRHQVDIVCTIPDDKTGLRRLSVEKNRYGSLSSTYFSLHAKGVGKQDFSYAYSVEGSAGNYNLHLYPLGGAKMGGILEMLAEVRCPIEGTASAAVVCAAYSNGFAEPPDVIWREKFATDHGLVWITPAKANAMIAAISATQEDQ